MSDTNYSTNSHTQNTSTQQVQSTGTSLKVHDTYGDFVGISIILLIISVLWLRKHK